MWTEAHDYILKGKTKMPRIADDICRRALETYGAEAQTKMVFEEMAELQKELCKHSRGANNREAIAEEIADVQIVLQQMVILYDCAALVDDIRTLKLHRLENKLAERGWEEKSGGERR